MNFDKNDLVLMLKQENFDEYFSMADNIRRQNVGEQIQIRALLEFSNHCSRNCSYCGLNCYNRNVKRFRLTKDEIVNLTHQAYLAGYKTIVLQSGEDKYFTTDILGEIVKEIKRDDIRITLSCGELTNEQYRYLSECGANRYLLKHETANSKIYAGLHKGYTLQQRINCLKGIKLAGLETGSGFMIGLPGQTLETIADDILLLKELECDMAGIGPFIPNPQTELGNLPHGSVELTLRAVALTRIILPKAHLPATTSLGVIDMEQKRSVFNCGANVIMQKITPNNVKRLYEIYPTGEPPVAILSSDKSPQNSNIIGSTCSQDTINLSEPPIDKAIMQGRKNVEQEIISLGRIPN